MPDAALPFRSRVPSPVDRALSGVEAQAADVRRRVNRFALERALIVIGGSLITGASVLVMLAFVLSRTPYAVTTWLVLTVFAVAALSSLRAALHAWLRKSDAVLRIDHQAALEDRLATLAGAPAAARRSRLWEYLLHDNLRLMPRWEPRRLQPRATPRSVWFFAFSLLAALLMLWLTTRGGRGAAAGLSQGRDEPNASEASQETDSAPEGDGADVSGSSMWSELPESLRQAILGAQASRNFPGSVPDKTLPVDEDRGGPAIAGQRMTNKGQVKSAPASPDAARAAGQGASPPSAALPPNASRPPSGAGEAIAKPAHGEAPKALERVETGRPRNSSNPSRSSHAKSGGSGSGGSGAGLGGDKDGLFGERQAAGKGAGSFALDLDALRSTQPDKDGDRDASTMAPSSRLSEDQRLDDAVRRAQVPVEYETIVQRIFNRGEEPADRLQPEGK